MRERIHRGFGVNVQRLEHVTAFGFVNGNLPADKELDVFLKPAGHGEYRPKAAFDVVKARGLQGKRYIVFLYILL
jgi:hypothetical protein